MKGQSNEFYLRQLIRLCFKRKTSEPEQTTASLVNEIKRIIETDHLFDVILEELFWLKENSTGLKGTKENGYPWSWLSPVFEKHANENHAEQIAEMLLWPEIYDSDQEIRTSFLELIGKIGNRRVVPILEKLEERMGLINDETIPFEDLQEMREQSRQMIRGATAVCYNR